MSTNLDAIDVPSLDDGGSKTCKNPVCIKAKKMPDGTEVCITVKCLDNDQ